MPRKATGSARLRGERWFARITIAGKRRRIELLTCKPEDERKAVERTELLARLAGRLDGAGYAGIAPSFLERAAACDGRALDDVVEAAERLCSGQASGPLPALETFRTFGERWTSGELHRRWPDRVRAKKNSDDDRERLRAYVYPMIGDVPLSDLTVAHADAVMSALPLKLAAATRRHVAQVMNRVLNLAAYPARVIEKNPLPRGFLPRLGKRKAQSFLYPDEDARLLASIAVPLRHRLFYGFLAREGMRRGEAGALTWEDIDLERGALRLDENKTDDPRTWALDAGVVRALRAFRERSDSSDTDRVFVDSEGRCIDADPNIVRAFREHLRAAGIERAELFERSERRTPIRIHDLRATFVTVSLANGKTETFVADRTGHRSSVMINRYRRGARKVTELGLGDLKPLDEAIPELRPQPGKGHEKGQTGSERSEEGEGGSEKAESFQVVAETGFEPVRPFGQRILNPSNRLPAVLSRAIRCDPEHETLPIATSRSSWRPFGSSSAERGRGPSRCASSASSPASSQRPATSPLPGSRIPPWGVSSVPLGPTRPRSWSTSRSTGGIPRHSPTGGRLYWIPAS